jgi:hypothetical protein
MGIKQRKVKKYDYFAQFIGHRSNNRKFSIIYFNITNDYFHILKMKGK